MQKEGSCCPPGSWPIMHSDHKPSGKKFELGDTTCYEVGAQNKKTLIMISDIFGAYSSNHQLVADTYAKFGYRVFLPQLLTRPYNSELQFGKIMENIKSQNVQIMQERFKALIEHLKGNGITKFVSVGFCWGVWFAFKLAAQYSQFIAIVGMHPSLGVAKLYGQKQAQMTQAIKCPAYFCPAGNDPDNLRSNGQLVKILQEKFGKQKTGSTDFPDMLHGWTIRGDIKDQKCKRDIEKALQVSEKYFAQFEY